MKHCPFSKVSFVKVTGKTTGTSLYLYGPSVEGIKALDNGASSELFMKSGAVFDVQESPEAVAMMLKKFLPTSN